MLSVVLVVAVHKLACRTPRWSEWLDGVGDVVQGVDVEEVSVSRRGLVGERGRALLARLRREELAMEVRVKPMV